MLLGALGLFGAAPAQAQSTDATLSALTVKGVENGGTTFTKSVSIGTFAAATETYTATVNSRVTRVQLTPTVTATGATVQVGKAGSLQTVASGSPSQAIELTQGAANPIKVVVTAADGNTTKTYTVTVTRQAAPTWPGVPQNFQATPGDGKVTLSWEAPSSWGSYTAAGYELEYRVGNSGTWQYSGIPALGASATSYEFTGSYGSTTVTNGVTYQFRIRSKVVNPIDSADIWTSHYTAAASATPAAATLPVVGFKVGTWTVSETIGETGIVDTELTIQPALSQESTVSLSVKAGGTASSSDYSVPSSLTLPAGETEVKLNITVVNDSDVESEETFTIVLSAIQSAPYTVSSSSGEIVVTIQDDDISAPTSLTVSAGTGKLDLSWAAPATDNSGLAIAYTVQHKKSATPGTAVTGDAGTGWVQTTGISATTHSITGLDAGTAYAVRVRAGNAKSTGAWATASGTTGGTGTTPTTQTSSGGVWSATLTVANISGSLVGCHDRRNVSSTGVQYYPQDDTGMQCSDNDNVLSAHTFTHDSVTYTVTALYNSVAAAYGGVYLDFGSSVSNALDGLNLCIGTKALPFAEASKQGFGKYFGWDTANERWRVRDMVAVSIGASCSGTAPVTPTTSTDATLSALTATNALSATGVFTAFTLSPAFAASTETYSATVPNNITHVKLTPTVTATGKATVQVGKAGSLASVTSGSASQAIALAEGANAILVEVTAQDTTTTKTYRVNITREIQVAVPTIASIDEGDAQLVVNFSAAAGTTAAFVRHRVKTPQGTAAWTTASVSASDAAAGKVTLSSLVNGTTYEVQMRSSATSGGSTVYSGWSPSSEGTPAAPPASGAVWSATLTVVAAGTGTDLGCSSQAGCDSALTDNSFRIGETDYTLTGVADTVTGNLIVIFNEVPNDDLKALNFCVGATAYSLSSPAAGSTYVFANANLPWSAGDQISLSIGSSCGGTTPPAQSTDATLSGLTATSSASAAGTFSSLTLTPNFAAATTGYTASVANSITHVKLTPTVNDSNASVEVGKQGGTLTAVSSGTASAAIALSEGANPITVKVTAEDGTSTQTYTVTVTRAAAALSLSGLTLSAGGVAVPLTPAFSGSTTSYTASVASSVTTLSLTPTWTGDHTVSAGSSDPDQVNSFTDPSQNETTTSGASLDVTLASSGDTLVVVLLEEGNPPPGDGALIEYLITVSKQTTPPPPPSAAALVSNIGQTQSTTGEVLNTIHAQKFTTGDNSQGYTLTSIELAIAVAVGSPSNVRAEVWTVATNGRPGSHVVSLNVPSSISAGTVAFTAPASTTLDASTSYFLVFGPEIGGSGSSGNISNTTSADEDAGAASGWSIADDSYYRHKNAGNSWLHFTQSRRIRVNGAAASGSGQQQQAPGRLGIGLTAAFEDVPAEHDGEAAFALLVGFSDVLGDGGSPPTAASFAVTGGKVKRVKQVGAGLWRVRVKPDSWREVAVTLAGGRACGEAGAVCAADGRALVNTASVTVGDPVRIRLKGGKAREGRDEHLDFTVSLNRAARDGVSVDYATADGTAVAGEDYVATSGTLVFPPGVTERTIPVALLDDALDEGKETFVLRLSNPQGAYLRNIHRKATGVIVNDDPLQRAWLSRFGRTVATHVTDAVGDRLRGAGGQDSHLTIGGYRVPLQTPGGAAAPPEKDAGPRGAPSEGPGAAAQAAAPTEASAATAVLTEVARVLGLGPGAGGAPPDPWLDPPGADPRLNPARTLDFGQTVTLRRVLLGSSFRLHLGATDGATASPRLTAWGRFAGTAFDGQDGDLALNGDVFTGTVGLDSQWDRLVLGLAVAHSRGQGGYTMAGLDTHGRGDLEQTLTSLHPYLRYAVTDRVDVWGLLGYGWGDLDLAQETGGPYETDAQMLMGAFGGRGVVLAPEDTGGFQLATRTDAMLTRTSADAVTSAAGNLAASEGDAHRLRLILEGSRAVTWEDGRSLTPTLELGLRHDWGDAETGFGVELGGRVSYADPSLGLTIDGTVRALLAHEDSDYQEWGASGTIRLAPGPEGRGVSFTLAPTWGAAASGVEGLWSRQTTQGLAPQNTRATPGGQVQAEVGYGVAAFDTGLLTPYAGTVLSEGATRTYRVGTRLSLPGQGAMGLTLNLEGTRQESAGPQPVNQGLRLQVTWGF